MRDVLASSRHAAAAGALLGVLGLAALGAGVTVPRVLLLLCIAPLLEEALFRAGVQEALQRLLGAAEPAIVATAVVFGLVHAGVRADPAAFIVAVPALAIGVLYARTGRLLPCVVLHAAMNALWLGWDLAAGAASPLP